LEDCEYSIRNMPGGGALGGFDAGKQDMTGMRREAYH